MEDDRELLEDLRALAVDGPQSAPDRIEWRLRAEFRKRKSVRRARAWLSMAGGTAVAAGLVLAMWMHDLPKPIRQQLVPATAVVSSDDDSDANFYPLPDAEALPAIENAMVVRVQMPVSSLRLMGVPMDEERGETPVQAELLLGQDGLARGVRLAQ